jgi:putative DNA primase/helicase
MNLIEPGEQGVKTAREAAIRLTEVYHVLTYHGEWYYYNEAVGVYERDENFLRRAIQGVLGDKWSTDKEEGAFKYLRPNVEIERYPTPDLVNVQNGMLRLHDKTLLPHTPAYRSLSQVDAYWDPDVDTSEVDRFVAAVLTPEDAEVWWMFCGYCLYIRTPLPYRCILALVGGLRTGKSTLLEALEMFIGDANVSTVSLTALTGGGSNFTVSELDGMLLNIDTEADYDFHISEHSTLKKLAEGSNVQIEKKYEKPWKAKLPVKLAFAMNDYPKPGVTDDAFYDRWVILRTGRVGKAFTVGGPDTIKRAAEQLMLSSENRSAWLLRSVMGLEKLHLLEGFPETGTIKAARDEFRVQRDSVLAYWLDCTLPDETYRPYSMTHFYERYVQWEKINGARPVSGHKFAVRTDQLVNNSHIPRLEVYRTNRVMVKGRKANTGFLVKGAPPLN